MVNRETMSYLTEPLRDVAQHHIKPEETDVQEWLSVPVIDESTWWQRLGIGAHEQPPAVLVRTDRQILLVKEVRRIVRGHTMYGSDAWLMPQTLLQAARVVSSQRNELELQITLKHVEVTDVVRIPIPPELAERALALVMASP